MTVVARGRQCMFSAVGNLMPIVTSPIVRGWRMNKNWSRQCAYVSIAKVMFSQHEESSWYWHLVEYVTIDILPMPSMHKSGVSVRVTVRNDTEKNPDMYFVFQNFQ